MGKKRQSKRVVVALSFILVWANLIIFTGQGYGTQPPFIPADITVTQDVAATGVEPIGANLTTIAGGTNFAINNHVWSSGFEPMVVRKFVRVDRAGSDWFEWDSFGGSGYWNLAWTGLLDGAAIRFYRIVDQGGNPLSYDGGTNMNDTTGADHVVFLGETTIPPGGYIANDDRDGYTSDDRARVYVNDDGLGLQFGDYAYIKLKTNYIGLWQRHIQRGLEFRDRQCPGHDHCPVPVLGVQNRGQPSNPGGSLSYRP